MTEFFHPLVAPFTWGGDNGQAVVLVHGFTGTPAHFRLLGHFLNERGFTVHAPLLPGHGTSPEDMATTGKDEWLAAVHHAVDAVEPTHDRVHLVGLSMGGLLGLLVAAGGRGATVTTINAPIRFQSVATRAAPWLHRLRPMVAWPDEPPPALAEEARPLWLAYSGFPSRALADLVELSRMALAAARTVAVPSLTIQSRADAKVRPASAELLADALGPHNRLVWLERSIHNALLDGERRIIHHAVLDRLAG